MAFKGLGRLMVVVDHEPVIRSEVREEDGWGGRSLKVTRPSLALLKCGTLSAMCYPDAGCPQLRVCTDFLTYLFHLDNLSDDMDDRSTKTTTDVMLNALYHPHTD
ncbi:hypothetical protein B0H14DRAFT_3429562 [Mycena olivaceomarginata]|nr:hypothetical protein B0H14DRAFT_3429562 [Mycena olivaceomarginata]